MRWACIRLVCCTRELHLIIHSVTGQISSAAECRPGPARTTSCCTTASTISPPDLETLDHPRLLIVSSQIFRVSGSDVPVFTIVVTTVKYLDINTFHNQMIIICLDRSADCKYLPDPSKVTVLLQPDEHCTATMFLLYPFMR